MFETTTDSTKPHRLALHIFRRDLRLEDNTALLYALQHASRVIPCFIFDPRQVKDNPYKSDNAMLFMIHSLYDLSKQLSARGGKLYVFYGIAEEVVETLVKKLSLDMVTFNRDYTGFSRKRDEAIQHGCKKLGIACGSFADALLQEPEKVYKQDKSPYTVFTPFFNYASTKEVRKPTTNEAVNYYTQAINEDKGEALLAKMLPAKNPAIALHGGTEEGKKLLKRAKTLASYAELRDFPAMRYTSRLSAHHKFGTVSIRQTYHTLNEIDTKGAKALVRQLYWRDFFVHVAHHFPHIWQGAFHRKYNGIAWHNNRAYFDRWCRGETGYPIVDAGMHQLNRTGYMHNRVRMITASFLIKHLHIDWRWGERYFAQCLIDYDPAVNNGSWQWVASTGCDKQPYFRIFNPWRQQVRFDPECVYIKKWLPTLARFSHEQIHNIPTSTLPTSDYPAPMVDHATCVARTKELYNV